MKFNIFQLTEQITICILWHQSNVVNLLRLSELQWHNYDYRNVGQISFWAPYLILNYTHDKKQGGLKYPTPSFIFWICSIYHLSHYKYTINNPLPPTSLHMLLNNDIYKLLSIVMCLCINIQVANAILFFLRRMLRKIIFCNERWNWIFLIRTKYLLIASAITSSCA